LVDKRETKFDKKAGAWPVTRLEAEAPAMPEDVVYTHITSRLNYTIEIVFWQILLHVALWIARSKAERQVWPVRRRTKHPDSL